MEEIRGEAAHDAHAARFAIQRAHAGAQFQQQFGALGAGGVGRDRTALEGGSAETAAMAARGRLNRREREKLAIREARHGKRRSGARAAIDRCFEHFAEHHDSRRLIELATDRKRAYRSATRRYIGHRLAAHVTESSKRTRNRSNPLFAINHTFAMMRDGISRLVRRSWGASKCRGRLLLHIWIWIGWRNYVRPITNLAPLTTPAMALYVMGRKLSDADLLRWRWPAKMLA